MVFKIVAHGIDQLNHILRDRACHSINTVIGGTDAASCVQCLTIERSSGDDKLFRCAFRRTRAAAVT
jgi:muramoyltetrapeptide carboxypeptidase LdcA involved in peptidoglycan recycling